MFASKAPTSPTKVVGKSPSRGLAARRPASSANRTQGASPDRGALPAFLRHHLVPFEQGRLKKANGHVKPANSAPPIVRDALRSSGQPLDAATRAFMEPRFGHDFSGVRVHTNAQAAASARAENAHAYTIGKDIFFEAGKFSPSTDRGRELLAHELTHVAQQRHGLSHAPPGAAQEREASAVAKAVVLHNAPVRVTQASSIGIARASSGSGSTSTPEQRANELGRLRDQVAQLERQLGEEIERFGWYAGERRDREVEARTDKGYEAKQKLKEATENMKEIESRIARINKQIQETNKAIEAVRSKMSLQEQLDDTKANEKVDVTDKEITDDWVDPGGGGETPESAGFGGGGGIAGKALGALGLAFLGYDLLKARNAQEREQIVGSFIKGSVLMSLLGEAGLVLGAGAAGFKAGNIMTTEVFPRIGSDKRIADAGAYAADLTRRIESNETVKKLVPGLPLIADPDVVGAATSAGASILEGTSVVSDLGSGPIGWFDLLSKFRRK